MFLISYGGLMLPRLRAACRIDDAYPGGSTSPSSFETGYVDATDHDQLVRLSKFKSGDGDISIN